MHACKQASKQFQITIRKKQKHACDPLQLYFIIIPVSQGRIVQLTRALFTLGLQTACICNVSVPGTPIYKWEVVVSSYIHNTSHYRSHATLAALNIHRVVMLFLKSQLTRLTVEVRWCAVTWNRSYQQNCHYKMLQFFHFRFVQLRNQPKIWRIGTTRFGYFICNRIETATIWRLHLRCCIALIA